MLPARPGSIWTARLALVMFVLAFVYLLGIAGILHRAAHERSLVIEVVVMLWVLVVLWPLLLVWRARRFGFDRVETALCAMFTFAMLNTQRLTGVYSLLCAAYLARDLDAWIGSRRWPACSSRAARPS